MQSRLGSLIESCANIAVGLAVAVATQATIFPWFGIHTTIHQDLQIAAIFTVVSLVRSYALRRLFNRRAVMASTS